MTMPNAEHLSAIKSGMYSTWEAIAQDIFDVEGVGNTIERDEVIDLVLDADRMLMYGHLTEDAKEAFRQMTSEEKTLVAQEVFPDQEYC